MTGRGWLLTVTGAITVLGFALVVTLVVKASGEPASPGGSGGESVSSQILPQPTSTVWTPADMAAAQGITISSSQPPR